MVNFKGFDDWIEVFEGGVQVDSQGREQDGDALIDRALATFNKAQYEPPAVIGHPDQTAPAYGWVDAVREKLVNGVRVMEAKFKQVAPEFEELVKAGRYKKRSASFFPDGRLRHIGFLGAAPPAVEGLLDIEFGNDGEVMDFEFADKNINLNTGGKGMEITEFFKVLKELAAMDVSQLFRGRQDSEKPGGSDLSQADIEAAIAAAKEAGKTEGKAEAEADFSRKREEDRAQARMEATIGRIDKLVEEKKLSPAQAEQARDFAKTLSFDETIEFSAGRKSSPLELFLGGLEGKEEDSVFQAIATKDRAGNADFSAGEAESIRNRAKARAERFSQG